MKTMLSRYEQETLVRFNEEEDLAVVDTMNQRWIRGLEAAGFVAYAEDEHGGKKFMVPKSRILVPRQPKKISEAQRAASVQNMAVMRQKATGV